MGPVPLFLAAQWLFPVLLQLQQNPPPIEWGNVFGVVTTLLSIIAVWIGARAYRERTQAKLQLDESDRKTKELEQRIKDMEREGKDESEIVRAFLKSTESQREQNMALADSVRLMSETQMQRADAQERANVEWRGMIDRNTMAIAEFTGELRRNTTKTDHMITLLETAAAAYKTMDTRIGKIDRRYQEREDTVKQLNTTLDEIKQVLQSLNIALTTSDGAAIAEIRRQVNEALQNVEVKLEKVERLESLLERLEAQQNEPPPDVTVAASVTVGKDTPTNTDLQILKPVPPTLPEDAPDEKEGEP